MDNQEDVLRNDALLDALAAFREDQNGTTEQAFIQALTLVSHQSLRKMEMLKSLKAQKCVC